jgi:hypothetical protein
MTYLNIILTILCVILITYPIAIFFVIKKYGRNFMDKMKGNMMNGMGDPMNMKESMDMISKMFKNNLKR